MSVTQGPENEEKGVKKPVNMKVLYGGLAAIATVMLGMGFVIAKKRQAAQGGPATTAEEAEIRNKGAKVAAEANRNADNMQQTPVGEGMKFDSQGNLLGYAVPSGNVPQNRTAGSLGTTGTGGAGKSIEEGISPDAYTPSSEYRYSGNSPVPQSITSTTKDPDEMKATYEVRKMERDQQRESMLAFSEEESVTGRPVPVGGRVSVQKTGGAVEDGKDPQMTQLMESIRGIGASTDPGSRGTMAGGGEWGAVNRPLTSKPGALSDMRIGGGPEIIVREGKWIDTVTVNRVETSFHDNPVTAMVTRDLLDRSGKWVLIPQGSKIMGLAFKVANQQQERMFITFHRIIFPDGRNAYFPERQLPEGFNLAGILGADAKVNQHWFKKFGSAIVLGVVEGLVASSAGDVRIDPLGGTTLSGSQYAVQAAAKNIDQVTKRMLDHYANLAPTISMPAGTTMKVYFSEDVLLNAFMPVSEAHWVQYPIRKP